MLCQRCHRNLATVRYAEVVDGRVADLNLCQECLTRHQEEEATGFGLSGKAPEPKSSAWAEAPSRPAGRRACGVCGMKVSDVLQRDEVGCRACYEAFDAALEPRLRELHADAELHHRGKNPHIDSKSERLRTDLQTKRGLLRTALRSERYEEAAALRDQIRDMEADLAAELGPKGLSPVAHRGAEPAHG